MESFGPEAILVFPNKLGMIIESYNANGMDHFFSYGTTGEGNHHVGFSERNSMVYQYT